MQIKNKWKEWRGGECPVATDTQVQVATRCGWRIRAKAGTLDWAGGDAENGGEIIKWREDIKTLRAAVKTLQAAGYDVMPQAAPGCILVNGIEVPEPMRKAPREGSAYWVIDLGGDVAADFCPSTWEGHSQEKRWLKLGLCHHTEEAAQAHAKALLAAYAK